eukprot:350008-Chlamydomonas_euryale.AAC.7
MARACAMTAAPATHRRSARRAISRAPMICARRSATHARMRARSAQRASRAASNSLCQRGGNASVWSTRSSAAPSTRAWWRAARARACCFARHAATRCRQPANAALKRRAATREQVASNRRRNARSRAAADTHAAANVPRRRRDHRASAVANLLLFAANLCHTSRAAAAVARPRWRETISQLLRIRRSSFSPATPCTRNAMPSASVSCGGVSGHAGRGRGRGCTATPSPCAYTRLKRFLSPVLNLSSTGAV